VTLTSTDRDPLPAIAGIIIDDLRVE